MSKVYEKNGRRSCQNGGMILESARVPHANAVGEAIGAVKKSGGAGGSITPTSPRATPSSEATSPATPQRLKVARRPGSL